MDRKSFLRGLVGVAVTAVIPTPVTQIATSSLTVGAAGTPVFTQPVDWAHVYYTDEFLNLAQGAPSQFIVMDDDRWVWRAPYTTTPECDTWKI